MGSRPGYSYSYEFSLGDLSEMESMMIAVPSRKKRRPLVVEMRSVFSIFYKKTRSGGYHQVLDEETFDICHLFTTDKDPMTFWVSAYPRMLDYWMSDDEILKFAGALYAFAGDIGRKHASLTRIPVYIDFEVCTVQQEGESDDAAYERAIMPSKMDPLYFGNYQSVWEKPLEYEVVSFINLLPRTRVEKVEEGLAMMRSCAVCSKGPCIGDQIAKLTCGCPFHSHCISRSLEHNHLCPSCGVEQFDEYILSSFSEVDDRHKRTIEMYGH